MIPYRSVLRVRTVVACAVTIPLAACAGAAHRIGGDPAELRVAERISFRDAFADVGTDGVFVLHRVGSSVVLVSDSSRANRPYLPASTFKIPNSVIALELGIVEDERTRFPMTWQATDIEAWNQEHTFASALQLSVVPVYQMIARQVGEARYKEWLDH